MQDKDDVLKRFHESFEKMGDNFHVLEHQVPIEQQMDYFKYSEQVRREVSSLNDEDYHAYMEELQNGTLTIDRKKQILSLLASSKQIRAYRLLENYVQHPEAELANWAYMALMESRIMLESDLSGEKQIYISSGLGGKGDKLRFYALFLSEGKVPFLDYQRDVISKEFFYAFSKNDCEIERLTIEDVFVELLFLMPVRCDIRQILLNIVRECNVYGHFLSEILTVTNVKELNRDEINQIIEQYGTGQASS